MSNETVKKVMAEKRRMTIGQLTDQLVSGALRRELGMDKTEFATLVSVMRSTIRRIEGLEATPRMGLIFNTAAVLRIGIDFPITEERAKKMTIKNDITELAQNHELLIANGQQTADLLRHLADNEIDSDYFAVVSECESYGKETDAELSITEFALRAAGYVDALVEALEKAQHANNSAPAILRQLAEEKQKRGEVAAATAFNYAASALQKELSK